MPNFKNHRCTIRVPSADFKHCIPDSALQCLCIKYFYLLHHIQLYFHCFYFKHVLVVRKTFVARKKTPNITEALELDLDSTITLPLTNWVDDTGEIILYSQIPSMPQLEKWE